MRSPSSRVRDTQLLSKFVIKHALQHFASHLPPINYAFVHTQNLRICMVSVCIYNYNYVNYIAVLRYNYH